MSYFPSQFSHANESDIVKWELDLKRYFNTGYNTVLATRLFMGQVSGKNPSFMHAFTVGNPSIMRGALPNRYTGNAISSIQTEYRFPIWRFIRVMFLWMRVEQAMRLSLTIYMWDMAMGSFLPSQNPMLAFDLKSPIWKALVKSLQCSIMPFNEIL